MKENLKQLQFRQMKMKLYTTITESEILVDLVNLLMQLLAQRFSVFQIKGVYLI